MKKDITKENENKKFYGYVRVSTKSQDTTRQHDLIKEYARKNNLKIEKVFEDKSTGKNFEREEYLNLINETLKKGDTILVTDLDRLGRNKKELLEQYNKIVETREADIIIINQPFLSTGNKSKIEKDLLSGIMWEIFTWWTQLELEQKQERVRSAIASMEVRNGKKVSRKTGKFYGRPSIWETVNKDEVIDYINKGLKSSEITKLMNIKTSTFYKIKNILKQENLI